MPLGTSIGLAGRMPAVHVIGDSFRHSACILSGLRSSPDGSEQCVFLERKAMAKGRKVLTTGEVAAICNVASRTVGKWVDGGLLKGYRIPGSRDRRIPVAELVRFMKEYEIPGDEKLIKD